MTLCEVFQIAADRSRVEGTMRDRRDLSEISENISGLQRIQTGEDCLLFYRSLFFYKCLLFCRSFLSGDFFCDYFLDDILDRCLFCRRSVDDILERCFFCRCSVDDILGRGFFFRCFPDGFLKGNPLCGIFCSFCGDSLLSGNFFCGSLFCGSHFSCSLLNGNLFCGSFCRRTFRFGIFFRHRG